ncbi:TPA: Asp-tRNA(Asn)/Glu-tRNA(Gln) amidotransferase subunit GatB [Patescibacteria group bacterium]|nr:MAG: Aspartyl/glutamyl-tRNA(Asn/Gln) amidotransferase subunit C [Parcubacteria group bacterium GW2011_GWF2_40_10]KKR47824.1 MAG: Aspartyl/glutamyl-tRNA(Asn/Gln) amidotransferase subunit C [Parcubacteria group bacterium GW2011_GWA2_40_143]KKR60255.1 MAG: Aspartyl/glutamyl-tRNA(Asn/Gln) amidotransferase subunit C [Parcubacteria group bacterium GW2011_GWC2_40_31]KKR74488.1 MAG: Aspartyl/glutamyl-tRNA(Asn/Gln) amidotransferase subunit C [Parcubacteria group bacterium GW2011_GWB2_40_8]KKR77403.1 
MSNKIDVNKVAKLARIDIEENEKDKFQKEFEAILGYMDKLSEIDSSGIGEFAVDKSALNTNNLRNDIDPHQTSLHTKRVLEEAPSSENGYIKVKHVFQ